MPDNNNRLDLNADLKEVHKNLAADVHAASEQVKKRHEDDRAQEAKQAVAKKSRKTSAAVIAAAAVILILISYFIVFGGEKSDVNGPSGPDSYSRVHSSISPPSSGTTCVTPRAPKAPPVTSSPVGGRAQNVHRPPDGYVQPGDDAPGM